MANCRKDQLKLSLSNGASYCGYGGDKGLAEVCPRLLSGISLQLQRHLTLANPSEDGQVKETNEMCEKKTLKESAFLIICDKVLQISG